MAEIKYAYAQHLKDSGGVAAIVGDRVFPRRLGRQQPRLPAVLISRVSEMLHTQQDGVSIVETRLQTNCLAESDEDAEALAQAVETATHVFSGTVSGTVIQRAFVEERADLPDSREERELEELDQFGTFIEVLIFWEK